MPTAQEREAAQALLQSLGGRSLNRSQRSQRSLRKQRSSKSSEPQRFFSFRKTPSFLMTMQPKRNQKKADENEAPADEQTPRQVSFVYVEG